MKISEEIVDHIAHLARLEFEGDKKQAILNDMENIISFMDKLSEVDTDNVEPLIFMNEEYNKLREDVANVTVTQDEALKNAPKKIQIISVFQKYWINNLRRTGNPYLSLIHVGKTKTRSICSIAL